MQTADYKQLTDDIRIAWSLDATATFAIIGFTPVAFDLLTLFHGSDTQGRLLGIYVESPATGQASAYLKPMAKLKEDAPCVAVIASDENKEQLLAHAAEYLSPNTKVLFAGYGHLAFRNSVFEAEIRNALVPSLATGYPNTLVHLYQCLENAARLELSGIVVEFGMFKGGTTMLLSRFIERIGRSWRVVGFDTFAGFPPKRSVLDMYDHPACTHIDEECVRRFLSGRDVDIVSGDVADTAVCLQNEEVVLAFVDTDNYSPAMAVLDIIQDRVVAGGAIVFDHWTGHDRFRYTLGERLAAKRLLEDKRYFNLHDTGVFFRQR